MARPADQGSPLRYEKEKDALRRLEAAIDKDPSISVPRRHVSREKIRALIDDLSNLIYESSNHDAIVPRGAARRSGLQRKTASG